MLPRKKLEMHRSLVEILCNKVGLIRKGQILSASHRLNMVALVEPSIAQHLRKYAIALSGGIKEFILITPDEYSLLIAGKISNDNHNFVNPIKTFQEHQNVRK